jgi:nicotinate-nucleotide adenylyltransferase
VPTDRPSAPISSRRIGVLGGTFDPPHVGHLVLAVNVRYELALDEVLLVVANDPWQKTAHQRVTPADVRLALVRAAVGDVEGLEASDLEVRRGGTTYTADTLADLTAAEPGAELFLILGSDAAAGLPTWERAEDVRRLASIVVATRPGAEQGAPPPASSPTPAAPRLDVSSTDLRARVAAGRPLDFLAPPAVIECIREHRLYG